MDLCTYLWEIAWDMWNHSNDIECEQDLKKDINQINVVVNVEIEDLVNADKDLQIHVTFTGK